jgi:hypothetical protein
VVCLWWCRCPHGVARAAQEGVSFHLTVACYLRVYGADLDVDALLARIALEPDRCWRVGQPRFKTRPKGEKLKYSGASFVASDAEMNDFHAQLRDARNFLEKNRKKLRAIADFPGVEGVILDFGIELRDAPLHSDYLPPELIALAARARVGIELSHYPQCTMKANSSSSGRAKKARAAQHNVRP